MIKTNTYRKYSRTISDLAWKILDIIYPPFCCGCGSVGSEICQDCFALIHVINRTNLCIICGDQTDNLPYCTNCSEKHPEFNELRSWGEYANVLKEAIHRLKYDRGFGVINYFIQPMCDLIRDWNILFDFITPVPLSSSREKQRGYNQSALMAKPISVNLSKPYFPKAIKRIRNTVSQINLNAIQRKNNLKNAFFADHEICRNKSILLLDDITTTGTTINECAKALKQAGAKSVYCITLARTFSFNNSEESF